ncbi:23S rRNA (uracil(1939)-C(5))-methyltransferase RlmD [Paenibacillus hunanensis]|uniref:23S rRNA (Uracil1939-C5)-methyltransferase n=1 Tax=Paenibacillus hunanensis TaxID=539262 RepID=A0ABU1J5G3_9BACL|nr:23S rRNA (uracil1939-C5)-methyltransferase [Paenibacillus hunanensis]GGJ23251.1 tRNA (uracil-5-)-methyltransferase [Paenibacillus hunanensis]
MTHKSSSNSGSSQPGRKRGRDQATSSHAKPRTAKSGSRQEHSSTHRSAGSQSKSDSYTSKKQHAKGASHAGAPSNRSAEAKRTQSGTTQQKSTNASTSRHKTDFQSSQPKSGHSASHKPNNYKARQSSPSKRPTKSAPARDHAEELQVGDPIIVTIKRLGINGEGVGYYRRKAVFIDGALPGEVIKANVTEVQHKFIKATIRELEKKSPQRIEPPCPVFDVCGGCQIQHISYEGQLQAKTDIVREAFARYTELDAVKIKPMLGMEHPWAYRNKAQLQLDREGNGAVIAGLYEMNSHRIVDISGCPIQHPQVNSTIETVKTVLQELNIPLYTDKEARDGVKTVVVRYGFQSNELQITLITTSSQLPRQEELIERLRAALPDLSGIAMNINTKRTSLIFGEHTTTLWGKEAMVESLGDLEFALSPRAFFQLNPQQTIKLYESVRAAAALTGKETVIDAYCGTGTIGLWLAPYAKEVHGIETIAEAAEDATRNAARNGRTNATFHVGKAEELLPRWVKKGMSPDVIIADPPRTGLEQEFLNTVLKTKPDRMVYVSCNPSTLAKDCKVLLDGGYEVQWVQPVDMFPQTSHVEAVTLLVRKNT